MDKERERRGHRFARYGDAFLIVGHRRRAGARGKASVTRCLQPHLKRELKETTSTVGPTRAGTVLGCTCPGTRLYWSQAACQDCRHRLRKLTGRSWGVARASRLRTLTEYSRGWMHSCGLSPYSRPVPALEA